MASKVAAEKPASSSSSKPPPPKLDVEAYLAAALSATPHELHTFFEQFQDLHSRK